MPQPQPTPEPAVTVTDRGFKHFHPIPTTYGHVVRVYESSAANRPHVWLNIEGDVHLDSRPRPAVGIPHGVAKGSAAAHMTLEQAEALRSALGAAIATHYQR